MAERVCVMRQVSPDVTGRGRNALTPPGMPRVCFEGYLRVCQHCVHNLHVCRSRY